MDRGEDTTQFILDMQNKRNLISKAFFAKPLNIDYNKIVKNTYPEI